MGQFEDFVNRELPRRAPFLTTAVAEYDGDPNDPGASDILKNAPSPTFYQQNNPAELWYKQQDDSWVATEFGGGGSDTNYFTQTDLVIPVDFQDVGAVSPPPGVVFSSQSDVVAALQGAQAFKYIQEVWDVLPIFIVNDVRFEFAAGIQRPSPNYTNGWPWAFHDKNLLSGEIVFAGAPVSEWDIVRPLALSAVTNTPGDPNITVTDTLIPSELKGKFLRTDQGQAVAIHDNDEHVIFVMGEVTPAPASVDVALPATIFRNSWDDVAYVEWAGIDLSSNLKGVGAVFQDIQFESFGSDMITSYGEGMGYEIKEMHLIFNRLIWNHEAYNVLGKAVNGRDISLTGSSGSIQMADCISWGGPNYQGKDSFLAIFEKTFVIMINCLHANSGKGIWLTHDSTLFCLNFVSDTAGAGDLGGVTVEDGALLSMASYNHWNWYIGKYNTIKNVGGARPGVTFEKGSKGFGRFEHIVFEAISGPCVRITDRVVGDLSVCAAGYLDGGGNGDVGFEFLGSFNSALWNAATDITGLAGDVRIEGIVEPYSNFETAIPQVRGLNSIKKNP